MTSNIVDVIVREVRWPRPAAQRLADALLDVLADRAHRARAEARSDAFQTAAHYFRDMAAESLSRREVVRILDNSAAFERARAFPEEADTR